MLRQVCMDFNLGVSYRDLRLSEIEFFYRALYPTLLKKDED